MISIKSSYWKIFRPLFVIFFLYLTGDVFYRWDGFRYYASFNEFLPSVALITILWSGLAVISSVFVWLPIKIIDSISFRNGWKIKAEHLLFFLAMLAISGTVAWISKRNFVTYGTNFRIKLLVLLSVVLISIVITWLSRNKAEKWFYVVQERITPLVWLFGILFLSSFPIVIYHSWIKSSDDKGKMKFIQSYSSDLNRPNILLVTFDSLASRDMSVYGYNRDTTPFIREWAKTASIFTRAEAGCNMTSSTTTSLMTGKRVWTHQVYHIPDYSEPVKIKVESLALELKKHGYFNIAIVSNEPALAGIVPDHFDIFPNFREFFNAPQTLTEVIEPFLFKFFGKGITLYDWLIKEDFIVYKILKKFPLNPSAQTSNQSNLAFRKFIDIIDSDVRTPYFAWIHLYPPHYDYLPPEQYKGMFDPSPNLRTYSSHQELRDSLNDEKFPDKMQPIINVLRARYDEFIRYCDDQFNEFMGKLEAKNNLKNTVIILSADHGESFEHNVTRHEGPYLFESMTHIPLIVKEPGQTSGLKINDLVEQVDIPATILDLAHIPVPSWMEGRSFVGLMRGNDLPSKLIFSMNLESNPGLGQRITKGTIATWEGDYKLIHYLDKDESLLFNLKQDPDELHDQGIKEPIMKEHLLSLIHNALKNANEAIIKGK